MGWLPSAPQLKTNPLDIAAARQGAGVDAAPMLRSALKSGELKCPA
jgi:nitrate reductase alpha subunit